MKSIWVLFGIAFCGAGCGVPSVETTPLNAAPQPLVPRPARSVEIYSSSPPTRPHVDVALLRAEQDNYGTDTSRMVESLAERAGALGCDALFISSASERAGAPGSLYLLDPGSQKLFGTCIAYLTQSPAGAPGTASSAGRVANALVLLPPEQPKPKPAAIVDKVANGNARVANGNGSR